jgi:hypothetical protein
MELMCVGCRLDMTGNAVYLTLVKQSGNKAMATSIAQKLVQEGNLSIEVLQFALDSDLSGLGLSMQERLFVRRAFPQQGGTVAISSFYDMGVQVDVTDLSMFAFVGQSVVQIIGSTIYGGVAGQNMTKHAANVHGGQ